MDIISVTQPWLYAMLHLGMTVENRTWKPPRGLIGQRIGLHASGRIDKQGLAAVVNLYGLKSLLRHLLLDPAQNGRNAAMLHLRHQLEFGSIQATAVLRGYVVETPHKYEKVGDVGYYNPDADPWFAGPIGWVFGDIRPLMGKHQKVITIPAKGSLGFWSYDVDEYLRRERTS